MLGYSSTWGWLAIDGEKKSLESILVIPANKLGVKYLMELLLSSSVTSMLAVL